MKYKIGDKVKYDGGDWWLYGTISAMFEHSICPCYRLNVERMEKKSCKFSITQFEFELEPHIEEVAPVDKDARKWETSEIEYLKKYYGVLGINDLSKVLKRSPQALEDKWMQIKTEQASAKLLTIEPKAEPVSKPKHKAEPVVVSKLKAEPVVSKPKVEPVVSKPKADAVKTDLKQTLFDTPEKRSSPLKGVITEAWKRNLENYKKGVKSNVISAWASQNRKEYQSGELINEKLEHLKKINFIFDTGRKKKAAAGTLNLKSGKKEHAKQTYNVGGKKA